MELWRKLHRIFFIKMNFNEHLKETLNDVLMRNAGTSCDITQTFIIKHKWLDETYKNIYGGYSLTQIYLFGENEYDCHQNWETQNSVEFYPN